MICNNDCETKNKYELCKDFCAQEKKDTSNILNMMFSENTVEKDSRKINVLLDSRVHLALISSLTVTVLIFFLILLFILLV